MIKSGIVKVNGETELRRGRKLYQNDIVLVELENVSKELKVI